MVLVRGLVELLLQLAVAVLAALVFAGLWAVARGGPFSDGLRVALFVVGALVVLIGAVGIGGMSPSRDLAQRGRWMGTIPGTPAFLRAEPGEARINPNALLLLTGVVLLVLGFVVRG
jgi:hypothetical protein